MYPNDSTTIDVAYRDPGLAYLYALRKTLADQALTVEGGLDPRPPRDTAAQLDTLFVMKSPPLREILPGAREAVAEPDRGDPVQDARARAHGRRDGR